MNLFWLALIECREMINLVAIALTSVYLQCQKWVKTSISCILLCFQSHLSMQRDQFTVINLLYYCYLSYPPADSIQNALWLTLQELENDL
jgi:hypothetical protein